MNTLYYKSHPKEIIARIVQKYFKFLSDELYLKILFWGKMGHRLNLENPVTFSEKLQWLKLHDRRPEYTRMVDKVAVKDYVASVVGEEYVIPTLGVWEHFDDIDFDALPDRFVLKTSQGGGGCGVVICRDKQTFDKRNAKRKLEASLKGDWRSYREWPYKNVPPRILAEKFLTNGYDEDMTDYKFFCFDGEPRFCQVIRDRHSKETIDFYDMEWRHQEFFGLNPVACNGPTPVACNGLTPVARPENLATMQEICRKLAKSHPFVRVDLYEVDATTYFGELTFYPASGLGVFTPDEWNKRLGDLLKLPMQTGGGKHLIISAVQDNLLYDIKENENDLDDYKFYCFNGKAEYVMVCTGRASGHTKFYFFNRRWELCRINQRGKDTPADFTLPKPPDIERMFDVAETLSRGIPHVRVDLYNVRGHIYFGELTFYSQSGFDRGLLPETDLLFGSLIDCKVKPNKQ